MKSSDIKNEMDYLKADSSWHEDWLRTCRELYIHFRELGNTFGMEVFEDSGNLSKQILADNIQKMKNLMLGLRI